MRAPLILSFLLTVILFSCCCASSLSQTASDTSYFPLALGNRWIYRSSETSAIYTETVVDTQRVADKLYFRIAIDSLLQYFWLREDGSRVFIASLAVQFDSIDVKESLMYDFSADSNSQRWSVSLSFASPGVGCLYNGDVSLTSKYDTATTHLGLYRNCIVFQRAPVCSDAGRYMEWFARGVGRVCFYDENIWGPEKFLLAGLDLVTSLPRRDRSESTILYQLFQNYPNPFNPATTIRYALPERSHVTLTVFNTLGQQVATLVDEVEEPGEHGVRFEGSGLASGVFFYRLQAGGHVKTMKMLTVR